MAEQGQNALWERIYGDSAVHLWGSAAIPGAELARDWISRMGARRVLDAGCGDGRNLRLLGDAAPAVVGTDVSRSALRKAWLNLSARQRAHVVLARDDIRRTCFVDGSFDVVVCLEVLSHIERAEQTLQTLMRLVAPGGAVVVDVFTKNDSTRRGHAAGSASNMYSRYYDRSSVETLCASATAASTAIERTWWTDPPHPGVREYPHRHETWTMVLTKQNSESK